jgi:hypothetical protein
MYALYLFYKNDIINSSIDVIDEHTAVSLCFGSG